MKKNNKLSLRSGGQILIDCLFANEVKRIFCVPGESYLPALDALYDKPEIQLVVCRHEGGATYMAEAYGKLTGQPGVCFVTRGPGASNAASGVHVAFQDSTPLILLVGQVARSHSEREAFQEIDYRQMFSQTAKWVGQIDDATRIREYVNRAFQTAMCGRPGPVVLALPEDMLKDRTHSVLAEPARFVEAHPGDFNMNTLKNMLRQSKKPISIIGGGGWDKEATENFRTFAESNGLPVACAFRRQDHFPNDHFLYAGDVGIGINPKLKTRIKEADLILVVGARLGEMTTSGYTLIDIPKPSQQLIHVFPGAEELGRVYQADLMIHAGMKSFALALRSLGDIGVDWREIAAIAHEDYISWTVPPEIPGPVQMGEIITWLRDNLPAESVITNGAGNFSIWCNQFYRYRQYGTLLGPTSGSMGYGLPAAVSAALQETSRTVIAFSGDGDFLMNCQELATAVQYGLRIIVLVINNGMYGTIRMHQERQYPGRVLGTSLVNPSFAALAESFGASGEVVEKTEQFFPAFERAQNSKLPTVIEIKLDPEAILPSVKLSSISHGSRNDREN